MDEECIISCIRSEWGYGVVNEPWSASYAAAAGSTAGSWRNGTRYAGADERR
jgi:hypothetical protein